MVRFLIMIGLSAVAAIVAFWASRRRPDPPSAPSFRAPSQLDPSDFDKIGAGFVVVFSSEKCFSCAAVWDQVSELVSEDMPAHLIDVENHPELHRRYKIDGVPTTVIADADGVVAKALFGPVDSDTLTTLVSDMT